MRVAFFGGTFDPPHRGHIGAATAAVGAFELTNVLFAPAGLQPLKEAQKMTSFADRLAMVELVCRLDPRFQASTIDEPRADRTPNYTVETLSTLRTRMPEAKIFSLIGADSFLSLRQWREPRRLLALAEWIVVSRPGSSLDDLSALQLTDAERKRIHLLETVHNNISATDLRHRLARGEACDDLLIPTVADYIRSHHLYTDSSSDG